MWIKKRFGTLGIVSTSHLEIIPEEHKGKKKIIQIKHSQLLNLGNMNASLAEIKGRTKHVSEKNGIDNCADWCESLHLSS